MRREVEAIGACKYANKVEIKRVEIKGTGIFLSTFFERRFKTLVEEQKRGQASFLAKNSG